MFYAGCIKSWDESRGLNFQKVSISPEKNTCVRMASKYFPKGIESVFTKEGKLKLFK